MTAKKEVVFHAGVNVDEELYYPNMLLDHIHPSKTNPRKTFTAIDELAKSIKEKGLIQPIVCRPLAEKKDHYEIIAGERRWRASKLAGKNSINIIVRNLSDIAVLEIQTIENLQREDVHELEEARGFQSLIETAGYDAKTLADKLGKSEKYVYDRMKLLALTKDMQKLFSEGTITAGHAILIARLPPDTQQLVKANLFQGGGYSQLIGEQTEKQLISTRDLTLFIQKRVTRDLSKVPWDTADKDLVPKAGACSDCPKRTSASPGLWPEIKKGDRCTDGKCYDGKLEASVEKLVEEKGAVRLTENYSEKRAGYFYIHRINIVKHGSCKAATLAIVVDGHRQGETLYVCSDGKCKTHSARHGGPANYSKQSQASLRFDSAKRNIAQSMELELQHQIYIKACERLELTSVPLKDLVAGPAVRVALGLVYDRLDSSVRKSLTEELKLKKGQYTSSADAGQVLKLADKMDPVKLVKFIAKLAMKNLAMGFAGPYRSDRESAVKQLTTIATDLGVKIAPIKKDVDTLRATKLAKAKARFEAAKKEDAKKGKTKKKPVQTSADDDAVDGEE